MKRFVLLLLIVLPLLPACGRKGDLIIPGTVLPQAATGLVAEVRGSGVILSWTGPDKNTAGRPLADLAGYRVMRAELPPGQDLCPCSFTSVAYIDLEYPASSGAVFNDRRVAWLDPAAGLEPGRKYVYKVVGMNTGGYAGLESATTTARFLTAPAAPAGLTARPGNRRVSLGWEPVTTDLQGGAISDLAGYNVYRSLDQAKFPAASINAKPVQGAGYEDEGVVNGVSYYYRLTALRGVEPPFTEGEPSSVVPATPSDVLPPAPPEGLRAVPGDGFITLSWEPGIEDDLAGYYVFRKGPGEPEFRRLNDKPNDRITYTDTDVSSGSAYTYAISAVDNAVPPNESGRSAGVTVRLP